MEAAQKQAAIETYQCVGCVAGSDMTCGAYKESVPKENLACAGHTAGTRGSGIGLMLLGLPTGFCRVGFLEHKQQVNIYLSMADKDKSFKYDEFNVPVWKWKNEAGHVFVRGLSPRINHPFIHIILDPAAFDAINCLAIDTDGMD